MHVITAINGRSATSENLTHAENERGAGSKVDTALRQGRIYELAIPVAAARH